MKSLLIGLLMLCLIGGCSSEEPAEIVPEEEVPAETPSKEVTEQ